MKLIAARAINTWTTSVFCLFLASGCANMSTGVGISFPLGPFGSIGVGVNSNGTVSGSVGVGVGPATVSVGTSGQLLSSSQPGVVKTEDKPADKSIAAPAAPITPAASAAVVSPVAPQ
jgi:hypothetical protein